MEAETTGIIISTAVATKALDVVLAWVKAKFMKGNEPHQIQQVNDCVSVKECNRRMAALDDRVTRLEQKVDNGFNAIGEKLEAMDRKSEERAIALHHKMDRIADSVASTGGKVELIERQVFKR